MFWYFPFITKVFYWNTLLKIWFRYIFLKTRININPSYYNNLIQIVQGYPYTDSRSTFEFPSRVNLSVPSLYCTYLALWTGLGGATKLTRSDFMLHIGWIYFYLRGKGAYIKDETGKPTSNSHSIIIPNFNYIVCLMELCLPY